MSAFFDHAAGAALPVAVVLLILAASARAALWAPADDERTRRIAQQYLNPLSTWCLVALGVDAVALGASGRAGVLSLAVPLVLAAGATIVRLDAEAEPRAGVEPEHPAPEPPPTPETGSLWSR